MSKKSWLMFCCLGLIWGASFLWIKIVVQEIGPLALVTLRTIVSVIGLIPICILRKSKFPPLRRWWIFILLGFVNAWLPFALVSWGEMFIPSGLTSILHSLVPIFTSVIAAFFLVDEPFSLKKLGGLLLGFSGVVVLMSNDLESGLGSLQWGILAVAAGALCYGISNVFIRLKARDIAPEVQAIGQLGAAIIFALPATFIFEAPFTLPRLPLTWLAIIILGILNSSIGLVINFSLLNTVGASRTSLVTYIFPLVGVLLGMIFLNESIDWRFGLGGLMIICGIIIINLRFRRERAVEAS